MQGILRARGRSSELSLRVQQQPLKGAEEDAKGTAALTVEALDVERRVRPLPAVLPVDPLVSIWGVE